MSAPRLRRALAASALVHVAVLAGLLALAHPRFRSAPTMRVALVGHVGGTAGAVDRAAPVTAEPPAPVADPGVAGMARPPPARSSTRAARPTEARRPAGEEPGSGSSPGVEALVSAVQSDVWVLSGSSPAPARGSGRPGASAPGVVGASSGAGEAPTGGPGADATGTEEEPAAGGQSSASLLATLSQRLAWSAARCAPPALVRTTRHAVPGVPLHFCLDGSGRPSEVRLLGTTGSEPLDRAARDCVVPGALPLPPVAGCYTVEVRFPTRE